MLGRPGGAPAMLLSKQRNGDFLVLVLKPGPQTWADGEALADAMNAALTGMSTRLSSWEDLIVNRLTGPEPIKTGEVRYELPPGHDDASPSQIAIYGGPGSGDLASWVVQFAIAHDVSWEDGNALVGRLQALASHLAIVPGRHHAPHS
jgi:hypothetical protein